MALNFGPRECFAVGVVAFAMTGGPVFKGLVRGMAGFRRGFRAKKTSETPAESAHLRYLPSKSIVC